MREGYRSKRILVAEGVRVNEAVTVAIVLWLIFLFRVDVWLLSKTEKVPHWFLLPGKAALLVISSTGFPIVSFL